MTRLSVMTYNILRGGQRGEALHEVVRAVAPDVLLVNECPKTPLLWKSRCEDLVDHWGMRYVAGGRPAGSNMIAAQERLSVKWVHSEVIRQPLFQPRRGVAAAQLRVEGKLVGVVSCHLSLNGHRRVAEAEHVIAVADRLRGPVVVAGDLNEPPGAPAWQRLRRAGFLDHGDSSWKTFPSEEPRKRIDALLVRGSAQVVHHGDPGVAEENLVAGSDHRPVLGVVEF
jgi:endonuclease/exonuclease/phosphatase family metal-dependent hydrolase